MAKGMAETRRLRDRAAGSHNTGFIKCVAILFMFADHAGKLFFPQIPEMRLLGRIAFPLFAWGIVLGSGYTRNIWRYTLRVLITGIVSQPLYMLALKHPWPGFVWNDPSTWGSMNIFFTLALGLAAIACIREKRFLSQIWGPCLALMAAAVFPVDYGWKGVLLILVLYGARRDRAALAAAFLAFCLFWGLTSASVSVVFGYRIPSKGLLSNLVTTVVRMQFFAILALPLILWDPVKPFRTPKWFSYGIYPFHLIVLYLIGLIVR